MKSPLLASSIILAVCTTVCGQQQDQSVEKRLSDLEKRVTALEKVWPLSSPLNAASPRPNLATKKSPLELVDWEAHLVRGEDSYDNYKISLTLKNNSDKDIKFLDATVRFADLPARKSTTLRSIQISLSQPDRASRTLISILSTS